MFRHRLGSILLVLVGLFLKAEARAESVPVTHAASPERWDVSITSAHEAATLFVATASLTERPWGVICDANGMMYAACNDFGIRKVDTRGKVMGFSRISPEFVGPGMAFDKEDGLLIADGKSILRIDRSKRRQSLFLPECEDAAGMNFGQGGFDEKSLYLSQRQGITKVDVGKIPGPWMGSPPGQIHPPLRPVPRMEGFITPPAGEIILGVAFSRKGDMFLAYNDSSIRRVLSAGRIVKYATTGGSGVSQGGGYLQRGMAFDAQNNLYVTDGQNILMIDPQGKASKVLSGFSDVIDLKIDPQGNLFVADAMEGRVYRINRAMERSVFIDRGYSVRMREMLSGIDLDAKAEHLYLADRLAGQILRYPIQADETAGRPEVMASGLVALRSIAVDDEGVLFASIDFPILVRIDPDKKQRSYVITGCQDFLIGRMALGRSSTDKNALYVPTNTGVLKLDLTEETGH